MLRFIPDLFEHSLQDLRKFVVESPSVGAHRYAPFLYMAFIDKKFHV